jgi:hypothetical protein
MVELAQFLYRPAYDADCTVSIGNLSWSNLHNGHEGLPLNVRFRGNSGPVLSSFYEYTS